MSTIVEQFCKEPTLKNFQQFDPKDQIFFGNVANFLLNFTGGEVKNKELDEKYVMIERVKDKIYDDLIKYKDIRKKLEKYAYKYDKNDTEDETTRKKYIYNINNIIIYWFF